MGQSIEKTSFTPADFKRFEEKLHHCLDALDSLLARPGFGQGNASIGAELELYLVDGEGGPLLRNLEVQAQAGDPRLTLELNRYNLEFNLSPVSAMGQPFSAIEKQMLEIMTNLQALLSEEGGGVIPIGILTTLGPHHFGEAVMTDEPRYQVLAEAIRKSRADAFGINIDGPDPIHLVHGDVTLEGACTSFQLHYRTDPARFGRLWNAIQLITPLMVGVAANSPLLLGHRLWHETRVPLFRQSIDDPAAVNDGWNKPARVSFGHGWLRGNALELFREMVQLYKPLMPLVSAEDPRAVVAGGGIPSLEELCLHDRTIWSWNRPIFDPEGDAHLRIEMRALPAGPTPLDMAANAALFIGLAEGLADQLEPLLSALPFAYAEENFYRAAKDGLQAQLLWPNARQNGLHEQSLASVLSKLLPTAEEGFASIGVEGEECRKWLKIIEHRLSTGVNGASWQLAQFTQLMSAGINRKEVCRQLLAAYQARSVANTPVSQWADIE
ncbi:glutamate--cysteine ligase [Porticoccus sp.]|uniref:glutamate--cysteine ligase n=1 Tax=Porticoccus sp. TaxID=2024853 RepID=UPI003F69C10A